MLQIDGYLGFRCARTTSMRVDIIVDAIMLEGAMLFDKSYLSVQCLGKADHLPSEQCVPNKLRAQAAILCWSLPLEGLGFT